ncbi:MAG: CHASE2 domain-containing protein [Candidatus Omnitrophota bacterium]
MSSNAVKKILRIAVLCIIAVSALAVSYFRLLDDFESGILDLRFLLRPAKAAPADKVAVIEIGDDSIAKLGRFPFDRNYHAIVATALSEFGAKAIVFDVLFGSPQEHDAELAEALRQSGRVYLPTAFDIDNANKSNVITAKGYASECLPDLAAKAKGTGHINVVPDPDGKFRRVPSYIKYDGKLYPNLSFLAACDYLGIDRNDVKLYPGKYIRCAGGPVIPLGERSEMIINYSGRWGKVFRHYSYVDVIQSYLAPAIGQKPILQPDYFKGKICIIGLNTTGMDIHPSPFEPVYPGVGIHAEILTSIIDGDFITRMSRWFNLIVLILCCAIVLFVTFATRPVAGFLALAALISVFTGLCLGLFDIYGIWLDVVCPILIMILLYLSLTLCKYISEWKNRLKSEYELGMARTIQESFLPKNVPEVRGADIRAVMLTARQVGGDLYEFIEIDNDRFGVMIGDVSGKGVPASLFMAMVVGQFRCLNAVNPDPRETISRLNSRLVRESASNLFVTMLYAIFDFKNKSVRFANGGHLPILYIGKGQSAEFLDVDEGMPLGLMDGGYSEKAASFGGGDIFIFYTDGVTEAMNSRREMYGKERLAAIAGKYKDLSAEEILANIEKDVRRFEPRSNQHDDITAIVIKIG